MKDEISKRAAALEQYRWLTWGFWASVVGIFTPFVYAATFLFFGMFAFLFVLVPMAFLAVVMFKINMQRKYILKNYGN